MALTLYHTAEVHRARFDRIAARIAPDAVLTHVVRSDWLERAQEGLDEMLSREVTEAMSAAEGPALCTCTTLGPLAEEAGALRVDWPMMQAAARAGGPVLMVYCLDSTYAPSLGLLHRAFAEEAATQEIVPLALPQHWPLFEAGETEGFAMALAEDVRKAVASRGDIAAVVLAQASMDGAADCLLDLQIPVLSSPELALRALIDKRCQRST